MNERRLPDVPGATRVWLLGCVIAMLAGCRPTIGAACALPSECPAPLVCSYDHCRHACSSERDCPAGEHCLRDGSGTSSCSLDAELGCATAGTTCAPGLVCIADRCEQRCVDTGGCAPGATCSATTSGASYCGSNDVPPCDALVDLPYAGVSGLELDADTTRSPERGVLPFDGCGSTTPVEHQMAFRYRMFSNAYLLVDTRGRSTSPQFDTIVGIFTSCGPESVRIACNDDVGSDPRSRVVTDAPVAAGSEVIVGLGGVTGTAPENVSSGPITLEVHEVLVREVGQSCDPAVTRSICRGAEWGASPIDAGCVDTGLDGICTAAIDEHEDNGRSSPWGVDERQPVLVTGSIDAETDEDCFFFDVTVSDRVLASVSDGRGGCPRTDSALALTLRDPTGATTAIATGDVTTGMACPRLDSSGDLLDAGRYTLCVTPTTSMPFGEYVLGIDLP